MATPTWFEADAYLKNKAARESMDSNSILMAFKGAGFGTDAAGLYDHFVRFGNSENVSPNSWFNSNDYVYAKAAKHYGTNAVTDQEARSVNLAFEQNGMSPWDHYQAYWAEYSDEGFFVSPSAKFDATKYMKDKLALVQKDPAYTTFTMEQLVKAFKDANFNPVSHYVAHGKSEGLVPALVSTGVPGKTYQLGTGDDALWGSAGDDYFNAKVGTLNDNDYIDGGAGNDTLYATVKEGANTTAAIQPDIRNVETIFFRAQTDASNGAGNNNTKAYIDAGKIQLDAGKTLTLGSDNSRADLSIEDVRHNSNETVIQFSNTDPGDVDFNVHFNSQFLAGKSANTTGKLNIELIDVRNAQLSNGANPLQNNPFDKFVFQYTDNMGKKQLVELTLEGKVTGEGANYDDLLTAFQNALKAKGWEGVITAKLGDTFTDSASVGGTTYTGSGKYIVLESNTGSIAVKDATGANISGAGWGVTSGVVPATGGIVWDASNNSNSECPLISTNIVLDNVGQVKWEYCDLASPNYKVDYGSVSGDLVVGSDATRGGVELFDMTVKQGSWLSSLSSTNNALKEVKVTNEGTYRVNGKDVPGNLYIGDKVVRDGTDGSNMYSWQDAPKLLEYKAPDGTDAGSGLKDVRVFNGKDFLGNINMGVGISLDVFDKYLKYIDGDMQNAPNGDDYPYGNFEYTTGKGNDTLNFAVNKFVSADSDFTLKLDTGDGKDFVNLEFKNNDNTSVTDNGNWQYDQHILRNVTIDTGAGNDVVKTPGAGHVNINTGSGNDLVFTENGGNKAVYVLNAATRNANFTDFKNALQVNQTSKGFVMPSNDIASNNAVFDGAAVDALKGKTIAVTVKVSFLGVENSFTLNKATKADGSFSLTDLEVNQIIKAAVNATSFNNDGKTWLSSILSAKDGAGHALILESLVDGTHSLDDLQISFTMKEGTTDVYAAMNGVLNTWYNGKGASANGVGDTYKDWGYTNNIAVPNLTIVNGSNGTGHSDNVINLGSDTDMVVLGTGAFDNDTIVWNDSNNGTNTVVNFTAGMSTGMDFMNFSATFGSNVVSKGGYLTTIGSGTYTIGNTVYALADTGTTKNFDTAAKIKTALDALNTGTQTAAKTSIIAVNSDANLASFKLYKVVLGTDGKYTVNEMSGLEFSNYNNVNGQTGLGAQHFWNQLVNSQFNAPNEQFTNNGATNQPQVVYVNVKAPGQTTTAATPEVFAGATNVFATGSDTKLNGTATNVQLLATMGTNDGLATFDGLTNGTATIAGFTLANVANTVNLTKGSNALYDFTGGNAQDTFLINVATAKTFSGGVGSDIFTVTQNFTKIEGGLDNDAITFNRAVAATAQTITGTIEGGEGNDTITFNGVQRTGADTKGDAGNDTIIFNRAAAGTAFTYTNIGTVNGGTGNDVFTFNSVTVSAGTLAGGDGEDTLNYINTSADNITFGTATFTGIETINITASGAGATSFTAAATTTGINTVNISNSTASTGAVTVDFSNVTDKGIVIKGDAAAVSANNITGTTKADVITAGKAGGTIATGGGADVITAGAGVDTMDFNGVTYGAAHDIATLNGMAAGDKITFTTQGTNAFTSTKVDVSSVSTLAAALDLAAADDGSLNGAIKWFQFDGNTYLVQDVSAESTMQDGDLAIKLTGSVDLVGAGLSGTDTLTLV